ncbi:hypothetical protein Hanom_Chr16g01440701 [Helianthus anomalus]
MAHISHINGFSFVSYGTNPISLKYSCSSAARARTITFDDHFGKADLKSGSEVTPCHVSSFGVPMIL